MDKFKIAAVAAVVLSFAVAAPAYANTDKCDGTDQYGVATQSCVDQVNLEDMRTKSGQVITNRNNSGKTEIKLRVEDQAPTRGRPIYGKDVYIDVTSLQGQDGSDGINGDTGSQ